MLDSAADDTSLPQRPSGLFCATVTSARSLYPRSLCRGLENGNHLLVKQRRGGGEEGEIDLRAANVTYFIALMATFWSF
jgi:hypothetical protein